MVSLPSSPLTVKHFSKAGTTKVPIRFSLLMTSTSTRISSLAKAALARVLITAETSLRYMNLVIGDIGHDRRRPRPRTGTGVVRISGFGAVYNNDFNILPTGLPTGFLSVFPRADGRPEGWA